MRSWTTSLPPAVTANQTLTAEMWNQMRAALAEIRQYVPNTPADVGAAPASHSHTLAQVTGLAAVVDDEVDAGINRAAAAGQLVTSVQVGNDAPQTGAVLVPAGGAGGGTGSGVGVRRDPTKPGLLIVSTGATSPTTPGTPTNPTDPGTDADVPFTVSYGGGTLDAVVQGAQVSAGALTPGPGLTHLTPAPGTDVLSVGVGAATTKTAAIAVGSYFELALTRGGVFTVQDLTLQVAKGGTSAPRGFAVRSDEDDYATDLIAAEVTTVSPSFTTYAMPGARAVTGIDTLRLRVYVYAPSTAVNLDFDSITIGGVYVGAVEPTEPSTPDPPPLPPASLIPDNLKATVVDGNRIRLDWDPVTGAVGYAIYEPNTTGRVTTVTTNTRTSGALATDKVYRYTVTSLLANNVESLRSDEVQVTFGSPAPEPEPTDPGTTPPPPVGDDDLDTSWRAAWATGKHETLRSWFNSNVPGPSTAITGTHGGGTISTQAQADALRGKRVTGEIRVNSGTIILRDFVLYKARYKQSGGNVTMRNVLQDVAQGTQYPGYFEVDGGNLDVYRVQIKNGQDGVRFYSSGKLTARYFYVHSVSRVVGGGNGHQDGLQCMGGSLDVQRSFWDYREAITSCILIKPDSKRIPIARFNYTFFQGGGRTMIFQDMPGDKKIGDVDFSNCLVAAGAKGALFSVWSQEISATIRNKLAATPIKTSPDGRTLYIKDAVRF